jgi:hypothetical protein
MSPPRRLKNGKPIDELGPLPPPALQIDFDGKEMCLKQNRLGKWIKIARRENRQWVPLFSNLRVDMIKGDDGEAFFTLSPLAEEEAL